MEFVLIVLCGAAGLAVGSFLNVVIWRVPRGESVVRPGSHCPRCDAELRPYDNVPIISWLMLRARCRSCRAPISIRYPLVELATMALFVAFAIHPGLHASLPAYLYLGSISVALFLIDIDVRRLPNRIVLPAYVAAPLLLAAAALIDHDAGALVRALLGMIVYYGAFFLLVLLYPRGMGFGDVKLAGVLGLYLGYVSWAALAVGAFGGVLLGGVFGMVLLASGTASRKSAIPFGPFMISAALLAIFVGHDVAHGYARATGLS